MIKCKHYDKALATDGATVMVACSARELHTMLNASPYDEEIFAMFGDVSRAWDISIPSETLLPHVYLSYLIDAVNGDQVKDVPSDMGHILYGRDVPY